MIRVSSRSAAGLATELVVLVCGVVIASNSVEAARALIERIDSVNRVSRRADRAPMLPP